MNIENNQLIDIFLGRPTKDSIQCESTIPDWAPIFEHHFPDNPILPGALMIEIMAQAGGFIYMLESNFEKMVYLASVRSAKFRSHAKAGMRIIIYSEAKRRGDSFMVCDSTVLDDDGRCLAEATLMLKFEPFLSQAMRDSFATLLPDGKEGPLQY